MSPPAPMLAHATSSSTFQISSRALTLRPVAARVISYGRSAKMAQHATLYVLRVSRGGREWYVARRYSEFRVLYTALKATLARPHGHAHDAWKMCAQCRELARRFTGVSFPSRFRVRSGFAGAREKIESARMQQLDMFLQVLMETTQGLLANEDDDDASESSGWEDDSEWDREDKCDALRTIREFLLVHEHLHDAKMPQDKPHATSRNEHRSPEVASSPRPRLTSANSLSSTTTTFRVQELDVMYRPTSPLSTWTAETGIDLISSTPSTASSPNVLDEQELDELFLADYASPEEDAVIHRQGETAHSPNRQAMHALRRSEALRLSRRM